MARLLVIDDENLIRMLTREAGEALGYEVLSAASLREGRILLDAETAAGRSLDLIVLDVMLPDGDGLAELERLTKGPGHPDVIVITGHGNASAAGSRAQRRSLGLSGQASAPAGTHPHTRRSHTMEADPQYRSGREIPAAGHHRVKLCADGRAA